jgi:hypothetical protein
MKEGRRGRISVKEPTLKFWRIFSTKLLHFFDSSVARWPEAHIQFGFKVDVLKSKGKFGEFERKLGAVCFCKKI